MPMTARSCVPGQSGCPLALIGAIPPAVAASLLGNAIITVLLSAENSMPQHEPSRVIATVYGALDHPGGIGRGSLQRSFTPTFAGGRSPWR